jgi:hypothetical protein
MKIVITGANSFVGKLYSCALKDNHQLVLLSSSNSPSVYQWHLSEPFPDNCLDADLFIHLAYDYSHNHFSNVTNLIESIEKLTNPKCLHVYFSSYSARADSSSKYGTNKLAMEYYFKNKNAVLVRPGLIVANQGIYEKIRSLASRLWIIPVPLIESKSIPICRPQDLILFLNNIIVARSNNTIQFTEVNLYDIEFVSLKQLFKNIMGLNKIYIKFPYELIYVCILFIEKFGLKLPVTSDNFRGYFSNN